MQYAIPVKIDEFGNYGFKQNRNEFDYTARDARELQIQFEFIKQENKSFQNISIEQVVDSQILNIPIPPSPPPMPPQPQIEYQSTLAKKEIIMESGKKLTSTKNQNIKPIFSDKNLKNDFLSELKARVSKLKLKYV